MDSDMVRDVSRRVRVAHLSASFSNIANLTPARFTCRSSMSLAAL